MDQPIIYTQALNLYYEKFHALKNVNLSISEKKITAIIGPSGCGKSTLLRVFNRMNDLVEGTKITGKVALDGVDIYGPNTDLLSLRKKVGMVFQRPNPFPLSVFENIVFGLKIHHLFKKNKSILRTMAKNSLQSVLLWDELKNKLDSLATNLSLEQQQRLCIARLLVVKPDVLLMDEPCSALDPLSTSRIEELMQELKKNYTIVIVTHNMQQAARVSDDTGYMLLGELVEFGETKAVFTKPRDKRTEDYITGRIG
ncbi:MAG: phosphate ABC transporter ATP-binding protein [Candidatus Omnitrophica bacterium CG1_02_46_14]|nr:MAG: phosphate ABC transporter ATP-binding protein [Candidatus Omnitrophica bacterium CG1_02_46_14]